MKNIIKLSDIKKDINFNELEMSGFSIGTSFYRGKNYEDLLSYIVHFMNVNFSIIPIRYVEIINNQSPIKVVVDRKKLSTTENYVLLNRYFISLDHEPNEIVSCTIAICNAFKINKSEIKLIFE